MREVNDRSGLTFFSFWFVDADARFSIVLVTLFNEGQTLFAIIFCSILFLSEILCIPRSTQLERHSVLTICNFQMTCGQCHISYCLEAISYENVMSLLPRSLACYCDKCK